MQCQKFKKDITIVTRPAYFKNQGYGHKTKIKYFFQVKIVIYSN